MFLLNRPSHLTLLDQRSKLTHGIFLREPQTPIPHQRLSSAQFLVHVEGVHKGDVGSPAMSKGQPIPAPALLAPSPAPSSGSEKAKFEARCLSMEQKVAKLGTWTTLIFESYFFFIGYRIHSWQIFFSPQFKKCHSINFKGCALSSPSGYLQTFLFIFGF